MMSKTADSIRPIVEFALYVVGTLIIFVYYETIRFSISFQGWKFLSTQLMLIGLGVLTARLVGRVPPGNVREKQPKFRMFFAAALFVPLVIVPPTELVRELLTSSTPTPIYDTVIAVLWLYVPFAWIITTIYGIPVYLLMQRLRACTPWSMAALGFGFMYVVFDVYPNGSSASKSMSGAAIGLGAWIFMFLAEKRKS